MVVRVVCDGCGFSGCCCCCVGFETRTKGRASKHDDDDDEESRILLSPRWSHTCSIHGSIPCCGSLDGALHDDSVVLVQWIRRRETDAYVSVRPTSATAVHFILSLPFFRSFCGQFVAILWSICGHFVAVLWSFCGRFVAVLWSFCGHFVVILWTFCGHL